MYYQGKTIILSNITSGSTFQSESTLPRQCLAYLSNRKIHIWLNSLSLPWMQISEFHLPSPECNGIAMVEGRPRSDMLKTKKHNASTRSLPANKNTSHHMCLHMFLFAAMCLNYMQIDCVCYTQYIMMCLISGLVCEWCVLVTFYHPDSWPKSWLVCCKMFWQDRMSVEYGRVAE